MADALDQMPAARPSASAVHHIYTKEDLDAEFRQAEIVTGITQYTWDASSEEVITLRHSFSVIVSQDCDLKWDYERRLKGEPSELNGVLLFEAEPWEKVKPSVGGRDIWKPLGQNKNERYQFLETVPADCDLQGIGLPELVIDFKKMFTIGAIELERQFGLADSGAQRRCRLLAPYCEHLQSRLGFYLQRIGIEPHRLPGERKSLPQPKGETAT